MLVNVLCLCLYTHTHTHIYIYIYIYTHTTFFLQMLVRRLGDEGRDILESDIGMDRLTVPRNEALFKREGKYFFFWGGGGGSFFFFF